MNTVSERKPCAFVTGASRGIGRAIAMELSKDHHMILGARSESSIADLLSLLPSAEPFIADLREEDSLQEALASLRHRHEVLDVLVHSAGIAPAVRIEEAAMTQWREAFEVNLFSIAAITQSCIPALGRAQGIVININSGAGFHSGVGLALYSGTKYALRAFSDALREELRPEVRVCSIHPGKVDTEMQRELQALAGNNNYDGSLYIRPESIAQAVRMVVDSTPEGTMEEISIRPTRR